MPTTGKLTKEQIKQFNQTIATNVVFFRTERGLSQDDLVVLSGLAKSNISRIENNEYKWKVNEGFINQLATAFKVRADAITESDESIKEQLRTFALEVHKWPISETLVRKIDDLVGLTLDRGPAERSQALLIRGHIEYAQWRISRSLDYYEEALRIALHSNDKLLITKARHNLSLALIANGRYERAETLINQAVKEIQSANGVTRLFQVKGSLYIKMGLYEKAAECYLETLKKLLPNEQGTAIEAKCMQNLGMVYSKLRMYYEAEDYLRKALVIAEKANDSLSTIYCLKVLSEVLWEKGEFDNSTLLLEEAFEKAKERGREYEMLLITFHLSLKRKDYRHLFRTLQEMTESEAPQNELIDLHEKAAELARELGEKDSVIFHLLKANELLKIR